MSLIVGARIVFGVPPEPWPAFRPLPGTTRVRFRFRLREPGYAFLKTESGIRKFIIGVDPEGGWFPLLEHGRNHRETDGEAQPELAHLLDDIQRWP